MIRSDLSSKLIHLTRSDGEVTAEQRFENILSESALRGSNNGIRGEFRVIAFSEAPISMLASVLANASSLGMRYAPLGVMVDKIWLYKQGGRPVIYQSNDEFTMLPPSKQHLHVRYEPDRGKDYTWEREWRIKCESLPLDPTQTTLIVPSRKWEEKYHYEIWRRNSLLCFDGLGPAVRTTWHFVALEDLGVPFEGLEPVFFDGFKSSCSPTSS